jgi:hypothetical protein
VPRLFALDHNFPQPIVYVLADLFEEQARLVAIDQIDARLPELDDWEVLLALHHHADPSDGLITTDSGMLSLPRELWVLMQTRLTLVVAIESGDDPIKATGLLFTHLSSICARTRPDRAQVWPLATRDRQWIDPMKEAERAAAHRNISTGEFLAEGQLARAAFNRDPLE